MYYQASLWTLPDATSSPASESGNTPCNKQDGQKVAEPGQEVALVNLSARQAKEKGLLTSGTCGQHSTGSSASVDLMLSLASKLRPRMALLGSTLFVMTWKQRVTPSGRSICALRASGHRTSGSDYTSWPSPLANAGGSQREDFTPNLANVAQLASWPTPRTVTGGAESAERKQELGRSESGGGDLQAVAHLASWATPTKRDHKDGDCLEQIELGTVPINALLGRQAQLTATGEEPNGSTAETGSTGQLNPALARWLMGMPKDWCEAAIRAHRSMRTTRRKPVRSGSRGTETP